MLNVFQEGRSHMAIVSRRVRRVGPVDPEDAQSAMTAAAGGLRQRLFRKVAGISGNRSFSDGDSSVLEKKTLRRAKEGRKRSEGVRRLRNEIGLVVVVPTVALPLDPFLMTVMV